MFKHHYAQYQKTVKYKTNNFKKDILFVSQVDKNDRKNCYETYY